MSGGDRVIRWSTAIAVLGVAAVAAVASYEHALDLVRAHGESGLDGSHGPADSGWADLRQFDGGAGFGAPGGAGSGAGAVAAWPGHRGAAPANVPHGVGHGPVGAAVAAWPAVAPVGSYELLMMVIRGSQAVSDGVSGSADNPDPLGEQAAGIFAGQLARIAFLRSARSAQLRVGQRRCSGRGTTLLQEPRAGRKVPPREQLAGRGVKPAAEARGATAARK